MANGTGNGRMEKQTDHSIACATENDDNQPKEGIPLSRKLCYAIGGMPYQMTANAKGFFMQIFLLDVVKMGAFYASLILFLGRAWDAVTDPLIGYAVSKSGRTRIGKLIPWIVFTMPLGILSYIMLWYTPQDTMSPAFSFSWYFIWCCLFDTFMSCYHVPYSSLNMFLGGNQKDRDSATGYRMGMEVFATLAGATIQGQIVGVHHAKRTHDCSLQNSTQELSGNYTGPLDGISDTLQNTRRAYLTGALVLGMLYFLCCLILFLGVKEQLAPLSNLDRINVPYLTGMKMVVGHTPYVRLVFGFLFSSLAFQMAQGNFALFCTHAANMGGYFQHLVLILLTSATISIPMWQTILVKIGKKTTIFIGLSVYIPALTVISLVNSNLPVFIIMSVISGTSLAALYLLPWSMLPDVVDDFKVKNPLCQDLEPLFYSCYVFFNKFGGGLSVGVSTLVLHFVGYKPGACKHNEKVIYALRILFAPVPICLILIGMVLFYFYPINEERRRKIQEALSKAGTENGLKGEEEIIL
ncbi:sodium-dependent lysophosphatidylcholine symporter 1 [Danio rerio]|uniref:Sodium-dependent lysophosphatidylcholine symporter 1 n=1 Tax=Danio rerio TaxID=7955 RepID=A0A8N7T845_DANRE|nr:sodium-dependent lysophosphatidylcholine symporter 1-like isoform X1 [Danio rerio]XP_698534.3 sodium-dependent lysophosphatidylcholine symporter 1-like isoform X1 [Danio rerio]|eukprot:XP_021329281.1 sodium-dependent lysophosphatidylcholine symporter 1-like isoform X1 [Danio rerio]